MIIRKKSTLDAWKSALKYIHRHGKDLPQVNDRTMREVLNLVVTIEEPSKDIDKPISIIRKSPKWVYPPMDEIESIILSKKLSPVYSYSYGPRIFNYRGIDQIDNFVIPLLQKDPLSRRAVSILWDPLTDANIYNKNVPGLILLDFKLRDDKLNVTSFVRSNDLFFGWPANIYQIYILLDYITKHMQVGIGSLSTFSTSAHIFQDEFESINSILKEGYL